MSLSCLSTLQISLCYSSSLWYLLSCCSHPLRHRHGLTTGYTTVFFGRFFDATTGCPFYFETLSVPLWPFLYFNFDLIYLTTSLPLPSTLSPSLTLLYSNNPITRQTSQALSWSNNSTSLLLADAIPTFSQTGSDLVLSTSSWCFDIIIMSLQGSTRHSHQSIANAVPHIVLLSLLQHFLLQCPLIQRALLRCFLLRCHKVSIHFCMVQPSLSQWQRVKFAEW